LPDSAISSLDARINDRISSWCENLGGLLRKFERNRYLLIFESKDLPRLQEEKFSILDDIRAITNPSGVAATLSIGIGNDGSSPTAPSPAWTPGSTTASAAGVKISAACCGSSSATATC